MKIGNGIDCWHRGIGCPHRPNLWKRTFGFQRSHVWGILCFLRGHVIFPKTKRADEGPKNTEEIGKENERTKGDGAGQQRRWDLARNAHQPTSRILVSKMETLHVTRCSYVYLLVTRGQRALSLRSALQESLCKEGVLDRDRWNAAPGEDAHIRLSGSTRCRGYVSEAQLMVLKNHVEISSNVYTKAWRFLEFVVDSSMLNGLPAWPRCTYKSLSPEFL